LKHPTDSVASSPARGGRGVPCCKALTGILAGVLALLVPLAEAEAIELISVEVDRDGPAYLLHIEAMLAAPPRRLLAVLTDYDRIHELHPRMTASRSLGTVGPATEEIYVRFEGCLLWFCRTVHRVARLRVHECTLLEEDVPGRGSFTEGRVEWRFSPHGPGARLHYEARFIPAFRVAPLFGAALLARYVERMAVETIAEIDRRAVLHDD
jgi:hypothetical protein